MAAENNPPFENKTPWSVYVDFFYKYFVFSGRSYLPILWLQSYWLFSLLLTNPFI